MNLRARHLALFASLLLLLCAGGAGIAFASPDGDDDPEYNAAGATGFGTQYSLIDDANESLGPPVTTQDRSDGSGLTAALLETGRGYALQLTRYDLGGRPVAGFGTDGVVIADLPEFAGRPSSLLDIRVLGDGTIVVLIRAREERTGDRLWAVRYDSDGALSEEDGDNRSYLPPDIQFDFCSPFEPEDETSFRADERPDATGYVDAARVDPDTGRVFAAWDCYEIEEEPLRAAPRGDNRVVLAYYAPRAASENDAHEIDGFGEQADYGEDLELGPNGDPYVLTGRRDRDFEAAHSTVFHWAVDEGNLVPRPSESGSVPAAGLPVDLAVDSQSRAVVWSQGDTRETRAGQSWVISRFAPDLRSLDDSWGSGGVATITDPSLGPALTSTDGGSVDIPNYLTVRHGDKVLATGPGQETSYRSTSSYNSGVIAGLTSGGQTDTGFGDAGHPGFKTLDFTVPADGVFAGFEAIGEPKVQSDTKVLVPHITFQEASEGRRGRQRIAPPPAGSESFAAFVGLTRLRVPAGSPGQPSQPQSPGQPSQSPGRPLLPSSAPSVCGRRAISLVRADVKGAKVELSGLVGSAFSGKQVTVQTDLRGARSSRFTKTTTVTASKTTGAFKASVPRPKGADFKAVRYRAVVGSAKSPALKLPQSLTSRSVKSAKGTITVEGRVKKSVLGKRNKVTVRRLVCGRYRTVGAARPDKDGNYSVTFRASALRGVAFYRAESVVQVRRGARKYAVQYARAIAIRTTPQTG